MNVSVDNVLIVEDWILTDTKYAAEAIARASGKNKQPVALVFEKHEDFEEYRGPDIFSTAVIDGEHCIRLPSSYTDATFLEGMLAHMGYETVSVSYGRAMPYDRDCVLFTFVP